MRGDVFVIGGSGCVGSAVGRAFRDHGHRVIGMGRRPSLDPVFHDYLSVDRTGSNAPIRSELQKRRLPTRWDVIVDCCAARPADSVALAEVESSRYFLLSSASVYDHRGRQPLGEDSQLVQDQASAIDYASHASQLRHVQIERAFGELASRDLGTSLVILRLGAVVGPRDRSGRIDWWLRRLESSQDIEVPSDTAVSIVDARDVAAFVVRLAHSRIIMPATFNVAAGPASDQPTLFDLAAFMAGRISSRPRLVAVASSAWLAAGFVPWKGVPLWMPHGMPATALSNLDIKQAKTHGFETRPWQSTILDASTTGQLFALSAIGSVP